MHFFCYLDAIISRAIVSPRPSITEKSLIESAGADNGRHGTL
jgi:hypothetical protein